MRLIDADVLKQHIDKLPALPDGNFAGNHSALKALINMQPTIEPSANCSEIPNNWIPCSERQPDVNGWYITTISGEICGQDRAFSGMSEFANGKWTSGDDVDETEMTIAWMPLPEAYQEGEQK